MLDANTLVSAAVASRGALPELISSWLLERRFIVVTSERILAETERALATRYFAARVKQSDRAAYIELLRREAIVVVTRTVVTGVASHPEDDAVLAALVDGAAQYLVTGDRALLAIGEFRGVPIVTARTFLEIVARS